MDSYGIEESEEPPFMMIGNWARIAAYGWNRFVKMVDPVPPKRGPDLDIHYPGVDKTECSDL
jgi:hypothetical protein